MGSRLHREYLVSIFRYPVYQERLRERLLNLEVGRVFQHAISKPNLVNLISKDAKYQFTSWFTLQPSDYGVIFDFRVD